MGDVLRQHGINPTLQRIEIACLIRERPRHFSAEEIFQLMNEEYDRVSQATVYNTLRLFVQKGFLRELVCSSERIYYDSNPLPHHHFYDLNTGEIVDLPLDSLPISEIRIDGVKAGIENVDFLLRGRLSDLGTPHPLPENGEIRS